MLNAHNMERLLGVILRKEIVIDWNSGWEWDGRCIRTVR